MKTKLVNIISVMILTVGIFGCQGNFLDEKPQHFLSPTNFYKTESDAHAALMAAYAGLRPVYSRNLMLLVEIPTEQTNEGQSSNVDRVNIDELLFEPDNIISKEVWNSTYEGINRANAVIDRVPGIDMPANKKDAIVGEALFLRALHYFNLLRIYGGIPLRLQETTSLETLDMPRSSVEEVYNSIIDDLKKAEADLPNQYTGTDLGRASKGAASTLLAYVYLTKKDWNNAATKSQEVIDNKSVYGYDLYDNYADLWKIANKNKSEHIFMCQFLSGPQGVGSSYSHFLLSRGANAIQKQGSSYSQNLVEPAFWGSFSLLDTRRNASILSSFVDPSNNQTVSYPDNGLAELSVWKYFDPAPFARNNASNNYPILRYADVLLINAEANNEIGGDAEIDIAYTNINKVRNRAGLDDLQADLLKSDFRDSLLKERNWEFCFEGKRHFDLIRTEKLVPVMTAAGKNPQAKNLLFPIPQVEIDVNNKIDESHQNPGY